jgi:uncharacterized iron-regulated membrane protein
MKAGAMNSGSMAATGLLVSSEIYADKTTGEQILASVLDIHRGSPFGWPGKLLFMVATALMPLFAVTGVMLHLSRQAPACITADTRKPGDANRDHRLQRGK